MAFHYLSADQSGPMVETFQITRTTLRSWGDDGFWETELGDRVKFQCGWYWQACQPGCLPDSDPVGPFRSEAAALRDARSLY